MRRDYVYIKLIQPKMKKRPMDTELKIRMSPSLGLLTVANILRSEHTVVLENENIKKITYDKPDIVGITVTVDTLPAAIKIAKVFRENGSIVVAGGIHITTAFDTIPEDSFDVLCVGAAEGTWEHIVKDYELGKLEKIYMCDKSISGKDIVSPAYDMIKSSEYLYCNIIHTSRGCPFQCDFCYNSGKNHRYMNRDIEAVLKDIEKISSKHIMFVDDNFVGNPAWTREFLKRIKPLKLKWNAAVSLNVAEDLEMLDLMKESGCQSLFIGFESINSDSIHNVHKIQNDIQKYETAIKAIHDRGIMINASFVFGLDGDTKETFRYTLEWIVKNKIETVTSHILTPYPGTELYQQLEKQGRITSKDLSLYNTAHVVFEPKGMSAQELYDGYIWIYKQIYSFKNIFRRMPKAKEQRPPYFMFNIFYRKFGKFTELLCKCITYKRIGKWGEKLSKYL